MHTEEKVSRRNFLSWISWLGLGVASLSVLKDFTPFAPASGLPEEVLRSQPASNIYISKNGSPQENTAKVMEMLGGIGSLIGPNDVVVLKPNAQWWNQGRTNLAAMKGFIDLVLGMDGFKGEVIIAENHHFMDTTLPPGEQDNLRGWVKFSEINGDIDGINHNINTLIDIYHRQGRKNVSRYHWRDGGEKVPEAWGNGSNGGIVEPGSGKDGYVWTDMDYVFAPFYLKKWTVKMTYPVFTSRYSGLVIDLKNGVHRREKNGLVRLSDRAVRLINFSALNTHGEDTGITAAVKNYMGIMDLSCGMVGVNPPGYFNVHYCGGKYFQYAKGGPIGYFMKTIKKADLNIVTAEWAGWGHRTDVTKAARLRTIIAGTDPFALDYYAAKYLLLPLGSEHAKYHDPDALRSPLRKFLELARSAYGGGVLEEDKMRFVLHDFARKA